MTLRSHVVVLSLLAALFVSLPHEALAYARSSSINYSWISNTLSGYSRTEKEYGDADAYENCWVYQLDENQVWYCSVIVTQVNYAAVDSELYSPAGVVSSGTDVQFSQATVSHAETPDQGNVWGVNGRHYVISYFFIQYCYYFCSYPAPFGYQEFSAGDNTNTETHLCLHFGARNSGSLSGDESLPDNGTGYYHFLGSDSADTDDLACTNYVVQKIQGMGLWWNQSPEIGISDISRSGGGYFPPHSEHQNGLDVDVRYVRNDGQEAALNFDVNPTQYNQSATQSLIQQFCNLGGASSVLVDSRANVSATCAVQANGHNDHFHVRFPDPDGPSN